MESYYPIINKIPTMNSEENKNGTNDCNLCLAILQQAPYGIIVCNELGAITFANQLASFLLQQDNLTGNQLLDTLMPESNLQNAWENLLTGNRNRFTSPFSLSVAQPHEDEPHLSLHASRLKETPDQKSHILIFIEDLSLNETLDAADQHYTNSLENLVDEKSKELEFIQERLILSEKKAAMIETAGAVAHELRQPMTTIIGTIELLEVDNTLESLPQLGKRFKTIQKQCLRMAGIIKQMEQLVEYKTRPYVNGSLIIDLEESSQKR